MRATPSEQEASRPATRPDAPQRILIVNPFGIGDVLFTTPLIRAVRQAFPGSRIGFVCNRRTEPILQGNPHLDELFVYEKDEVVQLWRTSRWRAAKFLEQLVRRIAGAKFDLVIDLSLGERYGIVLTLLGIPRRIGFRYRRRGRFLTQALHIIGYQQEHIVEHYRRLLHFIGVRLVDPSLELRVSKEDGQWAEQWLREHHVDRNRPVVGMVPAGGVSWGIDAPFRRWSYDGFAAVGDALSKRRGAHVILFGERVDATACQTVAQLMRRPVTDVSGQTTLGQFVSLLTHLDLVVCNDGGPLHLAVSQGVRTVSIFGPVDPNVYGPYPRTSAHRVVYREELACRPCYHQFRLPPCPYERGCLVGLDAAEIIEACEELLEQACGAQSQRGNDGMG